jgi:hypothetical protein
MKTYLRVGLGLALLIGALVVWGQLKSALRRDGAQRERIVYIDRLIPVKDSVRQVARKRYDTVKRELPPTPAPEVQEIAEACDSVIAADSAAIAVRDSLIVELRRPMPQPRLKPFVEALYDPINGNAVRAGAQVRLFKGVSLLGVGEYSKHPSIRAGVRVEF